MVRRLLAVAFGIVVIAGALAIRADRATDDAPGAAAGEVDIYRLFDDVPVTLLCAEELAALCESLRLVVSDVKLESAWVTTDRLAGGGQLGADLWMTLRPWPELARPADPAAPSGLGNETSVARSPIVLAGPTPVMTGIEQRCPDPRTLFSCAAAGDDRLMLRDPARSAAGALGLAAMGQELRAPARPEEEVTAALAGIVAGSRLTAVPYEDVTRLGSGAVALTVPMSSRRCATSTSRPSATTTPSRSCTPSRPTPPRSWSCRRRASPEHPTWWRPCAPARERI